MENNNTRRPAHVGRTILIAVLAVVILVLLFSSLYVVRPNEYGVVRQFGAVVDVKSEPGLYFKIPFVQEMSTLPNMVPTALPSGASRTRASLLKRSPAAYPTPRDASTRTSTTRSKPSSLP